MKIDKQIEKLILGATINWDKNGWGELKDTMIPKLVSQIKQSILKAIMETKPKSKQWEEFEVNKVFKDDADAKDVRNLWIGYNQSLSEFESVIKEILK